MIRSIGDQPGPRTVTHKSHIAIDGHDTGVRFADIEIDDAQTLRDLAAVAAFLAKELASAQAHQTAINAAIARHPAGSEYLLSAVRWPAMTRLHELSKRVTPADNDL